MRLAWICIVFAAGCAGAKRQEQRYSPGPPPSIGEIKSMCVEKYPAPRDRTDLGIGEAVLCWIERDTWHDTDICTDADGKQTEVADTLGVVVWSVEGIGTVYPIVTDGSAVTLTADLGGEVDTATVFATVRDSGTLGEDPPIQKRKAFHVLTPGGIRIVPAPEQRPAKKAGHGE